MFEALFSKSGLSLDRLHSFCRVAEVESFTRAADGDSNRQTLYSRQVKELETYFGTELFQRKGRTVTLTMSGRDLFSLLREYFSAFEDFAERCSSDFGEYVMGAGDSLIQWLFLPRLGPLQSQIGKARLTFKNLQTVEIVEAVEQGEIDFGIIRKDAVTPRLSTADMGVMRFSLFYPNNGKDVSQDMGELLSAFSFVGMEGHGSYSLQIDQLAARHRAMVRFAVKCSSFPMMAHAAKALGLAAFLPKIAEDEFAEAGFGQTMMPDLERIERKLVLCWNERKARLDENLSTRGQRIADTIRF